MSSRRHQLYWKTSWAEWEAVAPPTRPGNFRDSIYQNLYERGPGAECTSRVFRKPTVTNLTADGQTQAVTVGGGDVNSTALNTEVYEDDGDDAEEDAGNEETLELGMGESDRQDLASNSTGGAENVTESASPANGTGPDSSTSPGGVTTTKTPIYVTGAPASVSSTAAVSTANSTEVAVSANSTTAASINVTSTNAPAVNTTDAPEAGGGNSTEVPAVSSTSTVPNPPGNASATATEIPENATATATERPENATLTGTEVPENATDKSVGGGVVMGGGGSTEAPANNSTEAPGEVGVLTVGDGAAEVEENGGGVTVKVEGVR